MIEQDTIDYLTQHWQQLTANELRAALINPDAGNYVSLDTRTPAMRGYAGPRERLPLPERFRRGGKDWRSIDYENKDDPHRLRQLVEEVKKAGLRKIVVAFPSSERRIKEAIKRSQNNDFAKDENEIIYSELQGLDLKQHIEQLELLAKQHNITLEFLPMVKLTNTTIKSFDFDKVNSIIPSVRLWTDKRPLKDAAYYLVDDITISGITLSTMLSHLTHHGIDDSHLIRCKAAERNIGLTDAQLNFMRHLRANKPEIADKADVVLQLIGIDSIEALMPRELPNTIDWQCYEEKDFPFTRFEQDAQKFDLKMKNFLDVYLHSYQPVAEPTPQYTDKIRQLQIKRSPVER